MDKLSIMFSALLITWFILFDQQIITKTVGFSVDYESADTYDEVLVTTENVTPDENTTDINDNYRNTLVIGNKTPAHSGDKKEMDKSESSSDDVIELNVGGQRITTFRSTLTAIPNSKLAILFSKDNKKKRKPKTKQDMVYFFDYNPAQFQYLLDQLRAVKRMPEIQAYELNIVAPKIDVRFNFSTMVFELGLNPDRFLSPLIGTHLDLKVDSLIGWKECYRGEYNTPFDATILTNTCKGKRLLVACRSDSDKKTLIVAGVGKREDIFRTCTPNSYCTPETKNGTGFYYVQDHAWGFQGRSQELATTYNPYMHHNYGGASQGSFLLNPCDSSDENAKYRLCWSLRSNVGRGGGDRCGSSKNLHNTKGWQRLIYQTV